MLTAASPRGPRWGNHRPQPPPVTALGMGRRRRSTRTCTAGSSPSTAGRQCAASSPPTSSSLDSMASVLRLVRLSPYPTRPPFSENCSNNASLQIIECYRMIEWIGCQVRVLGPIKQLRCPCRAYFLCFASKYRPATTATHKVSHTAAHSNNYSLRPKINAILGPNTQTNDRCKITKIPFVFCGE